MLIRNAKEEDYMPVITVLNDWWGGRQMADMLPRLFFKHFKKTSFIIEKDGEIVAFLVGFISQDDPAKAYIHFVGIHPAHRKEGLGRAIYEKFFQTVKEKGVKRVHSVTNIVNKLSVAFHRKMGFNFEEGDEIKEGIWVHHNYDGPGPGDIILFYKDI